MSNSTLPFTGRNAIVTGASRGLGAQIALDLAKAGANVLIVSMQSIASCTLLIDEKHICCGALHRIIHPSHRHSNQTLSWKRCVKPILMLKRAQYELMCKRPTITIKYQRTNW